MLRDNVIALSSNCRVSLYIEPYYKMPIFPFLHIIALISFMFKLHCGIMLSKSRDLNYFLNTLFNKSCAATSFARIHY